MKRALPPVAAPALAAACLCLAGCAQAEGKYPSLTIRPAERVEGVAQAADSAPDLPAPPPPAATLKARIAQLVDSARQAHASFTAREESATRVISGARGAQPPSDGWVAAQVALAALQARRSDAVISLGHLDQMYSDERLANPGDPTPTAQAIDAARAQVTALIDEENGVIAALSGQLAG